MASYLDSDKEVKVFTSDRGFTTFSGYYNNVPVSIVSIGMVGINKIILNIRKFLTLV